MKVTIDFGTGFPFTADINPKDHLTENFTLEEYCNNKAKDEIKAVLTPTSVKFAMMLQELRNLRGSIHENSWYRTASFNKSCGGDANSQHLRGLAFDWGINNQTDEDRKEVENLWRKLCKQNGFAGQINFYTHGYHLAILPHKYDLSFVVYDYRGKKGDW